MWVRQRRRRAALRIGNSQMESMVDMTLYLLLYLNSDSFSPHSVKMASSSGDLHDSVKVKVH